MAAKGHAKGVIKAPDIVSSVVVDTSNAERELSNFLTKMQKSKKELSIDVGIGALKNAKTVWDAMASEMNRFGKTEIFDGMAQSFEQVNDAFKNIKVIVNGQELQGLVNIVKSLSSADFDRISRIDFGSPELKNNLMEVKQIEATTKKIVKNEQEINKVKQKRPKEADPLKSIKSSVTRQKNLIEGFSIDLTSEESFSASMKRLEGWKDKLIELQKKLQDLQPEGLKGAAENVNNEIEFALQGIGTKIEAAQKQLTRKSTDVVTDIATSAKKLRQEFDTQKNTKNDKGSDRTKELQSFAVEGHKLVENLTQNSPQVAKFGDLLNQVSNGALSAADAMKQLVEFTESLGSTTNPVENLAKQTQESAKATTEATAKQIEAEKEYAKVTKETAKAIKSENNGRQLKTFDLANMTAKTKKPELRQIKEFAQDRWQYANRQVPVEWEESIKKRGKTFEVIGDYVHIYDELGNTVVKAFSEIQKMPTGWAQFIKKDGSSFEIIGDYVHVYDELGNTMTKALSEMSKSALTKLMSNVSYAIFEDETDGNERLFDTQFGNLSSYIAKDNELYDESRRYVAAYREEVQKLHGALHVDTSNSKRRLSQEEAVKYEELAVSAEDVRKYYEERQRIEREAYAKQKEFDELKEPTETKSEYEQMDLLNTDADKEIKLLEARVEYHKKCRQLMQETADLAAEYQKLPFQQVDSKSLLIGDADEEQAYIEHLETKLQNKKDQLVQAIDTYEQVVEKLQEYVELKKKVAESYQAGEVDVESQKQLRNVQNQLLAGISDTNERSNIDTALALTGHLPNFKFDDMAKRISGALNIKDATVAIEAQTRALKENAQARKEVKDVDQVLSSAIDKYTQLTGKKPNAVFLSIIEQAKQSLNELNNDDVLAGLSDSIDKTVSTQALKTLLRVPEGIQQGFSSIDSFGEIISDQFKLSIANVEPLNSEILALIDALVRIKNETGDTQFSGKGLIQLFTEDELKNIGLTVEQLGHFETAQDKLYSLMNSQRLSGATSYDRTLDLDTINLYAVDEARKKLHQLAQEYPDVKQRQDEFFNALQSQGATKRGGVLTATLDQLKAVCDKFPEAQEYIEKLLVQRNITSSGQTTMFVGMYDPVEKAVQAADQLSDEIQIIDHQIGLLDDNGALKEEFIQSADAAKQETVEIDKLADARERLKKISKQARNDERPTSNVSTLKGREKALTERLSEIESIKNEFPELESRCVQVEDRVTRALENIKNAMKADTAVGADQLQQTAVKTDTAYDGVSDAVSNVSGELKEATQTAEQLADAAEKAANSLVAIHGLSSQNLMAALKEGAFPSPSIAITKPNVHSGGYGDATVVFKRDAVDPSKNPANKVYGVDAYTPTYPAFGYELDEEGLKRASEKTGIEIDRLRFACNAAYANIEEAVGNLAFSSDDLRLDLQKAYLKERGIKIDPVEVYEDVEGRFHTEDEEFHNRARDIITRDGVTFDSILDDHKLQQEYFDAIDESVRLYNERFEVWPQAQIKPERVEEFKNRIKNARSDNDVYEKERAIFEHDQAAIRGELKTIDIGKTNSQIFKAAMEDNKQDYRNYVESILADFMVKPFAKGYQGQRFDRTPEGIAAAISSFGGKNALYDEDPFMRRDMDDQLFIIGAAKNYQNWDEIEADSNRLQRDAQGTHTKLDNGYIKGIARVVAQANNIEDQQAFDKIVQAVDGNTTAEAIGQALRVSGLTVDDNNVQQLAMSAWEASNVLTRYFEAKPQRAVGLDEIQFVSVPKGSTQLMSMLEQKGIKYVEHESNDFDDREKVLIDGMQQFQASDEKRAWAEEAQRIRDAAIDVTDAVQHTTVAYEDAASVTQEHTKAQNDIDKFNQYTMDGALIDSMKLAGDAFDQEKKRQYDVGLDDIHQRIKTSIESGVLTYEQAVQQLDTEVNQLYDSLAMSTEQATQATRKMTGEEYTKFMKGVDLNKFFDDNGVDKENQGAIRDAFTKLGEVMLSKASADANDEDVQSQIQNVVSLMQKHAKQPVGTYEASLGYMLDELQGAIFYNEDDKKQIGKEKFAELKEKIAGKLHLTTVDKPENLSIDSFFTSQLSDQVRSALIDMYNQTHDEEFNGTKQAILEAIASGYQAAKRDKANAGTKVFDELSDPDAIKLVTDSANALVGQAVGNIQSMRQSQEAAQGEAAGFEEVAAGADKAAESKDKFNKANKRVKSGTKESTEGIEEEARGLNRLAKEAAEAEDAWRLLRKAEENTGTKYNFGEVKDSDTFFNKIKDFANDVSSDADLKIGKIKVGVNDEGIYTASIDYYNEATKLAIKQTYELRDGMLQLGKADFSQNFKKLDQIKENEAKYFASKDKHAYEGLTFNGADADAADFDFSDKEAALRSFVDTFTKGQGVVTDFITTANGIRQVDFFVFDENAKQIRTFTAEVGQFSDQMYYTETSMKGLTAGSDAASKAMLAIGSAIQRLSDIGGADQKIQELYQKLEALRTAMANMSANGTLQSFGSQLELQTMAQGAMDLVKQITALEKGLNKTQEAVKNGKLEELGKIKLDGDFESQMRSLVGAIDKASVSNVEFDNNTKELSYTLTYADGHVENLIASVNELNGVVTVSQAKTSQLKGIWSGLGDAIKDLGVGSYINNMLDMGSIIQGLKTGFNEVLEIDTALTELKKVTNETDVVYTRFLQNMSKTGAVVGSTVKDLTTSAANWARLGYNIEEASKLAENTMVLMNVSEFTDVTTATDTMISAIQAFKQEGADVGAFSMEIIDIFNKIGNSYAISTSDLADSLTRSSASLVAANNSIEQAVALTTAANATIQNPETVGTTLKTLSMRIRGVKTELEAAGEDTEGVIENTSKLKEKVQALTNVDGSGGVNILTNSEEFKSTYDILLEISKVWDKMSDVDQAALLEIIAGKRAGSAVASILSNGDVLKNAYNDALNADGSAQNELNTYLDSIQGKIDQLTNSTQTMWMNFMNSEFLKWLIDVANGFVKITDKVGLLQVAISAFMAKAAFKGDGFGQFFDADNIAEKVNNWVHGIDDIADAADDAADGLDLVTDAQKAQGDAAGVAAGKSAGAAASQKTLGITAKAASFGVRLLNSALMMVASMAITYVIGQVISSISEAANRMDELRDSAIDSAQETKEAQKSLSDYKEEVDDLRTKLDSNTLSEAEAYNARARLIEIQDELIEKFGKEAEGINLVTGAIKTQKDAIDSLAQSAASKWLDENAEAYQAAKKAMEDVHSGSQLGKDNTLTLFTQTNTVNAQGKKIKAGTLADASDEIISQYKAGIEEIAKNFGWEFNENGAFTTAGEFENIYATFENKTTEEIEQMLDALQEFIHGFTSTHHVDLSNETARITKFRKQYADDDYLEHKQVYDEGREQEAIAHYAKEYGEILDAQEKFYDATSDEERLAAIEKINDKIQAAQEKAPDYMDDWFGDIGAQFDEQEFELKVKLNKDDMQTDLANIIKDSGLSALDNNQIQNMIDSGLNKEGAIVKNDAYTQDQIQGLVRLQAEADKAGISIDSLIALLVQLGIVTGQPVDTKVEPVVETVKTYSALSEEASNYNDILSQTNEISGDNIKITQEYKDALTALGFSTEELSECFDENIGLIVKNSRKLRELVAQKKNELATDTKLAKAQSQLEYYELVQQLNSTLSSERNLNDATLETINSTLSQIDAVRQAIYQYQLLEDSLLGTTNAFEAYKQAQEIDAQNTYGDDYVSMAQTMYDALYKTGEVGTEQMESAITALVPDSVYQGLTDDAEKMKAIYEYFNKNILPTLTLDEDQLSLDHTNIDAFVNKGIDAGIFTGEKDYDGNVKSFDLVEGMNLEEAAKLMGMTETQAYAMFAALDKYNVSMGEQSFLQQLDDSTSGDIMEVTTKLEDLNKQKLALLKDGGYAKNGAELEDVNKQIEEQTGKLQDLESQSYSIWRNYTQTDAALAGLQEVEDKTAKLSQEDAIELGVEWKENMTVEDAIKQLEERKAGLEEPTTLTAQLASDKVQEEIDELKAGLEEDGIDIEANIQLNEDGQYEVVGDGSNKQLQTLAGLMNEQQALETFLQTGLTPTETYLNDIKTIISEINGKIPGTTSPSAGASDGTEADGSSDTHNKTTGSKAIAPEEMSPTGDVTITTKTATVTPENSGASETGAGTAGNYGQPYTDPSVYYPNQVDIYDPYDTKRAWDTVKKSYEMDSDDNNKQHVDTEEASVTAENVNVVASGYKGASDTSGAAFVPGIAYTDPSVYYPNQINVDDPSDRQRAWKAINKSYENDSEQASIIVENAEIVTQEHHGLSEAGRSTFSPGSGYIDPIASYYPNQPDHVDVAKDRENAYNAIKLPNSQATEEALITIQNARIISGDDTSGSSGNEDLLHSTYRESDNGITAMPAYMDHAYMQNSAIGDRAWALTTIGNLEKQDDDTKNKDTSVEGANVEVIKANAIVGTIYKDSATTQSIPEEVAEQVRSVQESTTTDTVNIDANGIQFTGIQANTLPVSNIPAVQSNKNNTEDDNASNFKDIVANMLGTDSYPDSFDKDDQAYLKFQERVLSTLPDAPTTAQQSTISASPIISTEMPVDDNGKLTVGVIEAKDANVENGIKTPDVTVSDIPSPLKSLEDQDNIFERIGNFIDGLLNGQPDVIDHPESVSSGIGDTYESNDISNNLVLTEQAKEQIALLNTETQTATAEVNAMWQEYANNGAAMDAIASLQDHTRLLTAEEASVFGIEVDESGFITAGQAYIQLKERQDELQQPVETTVTLTTENIDSQIAALQQKRQQIESSMIITPELKEATTTAIDAQITKLQAEKIIISATIQPQTQEAEEGIEGVNATTVDDKTVIVTETGAAETKNALEAVDAAAGNVVKTVTTHYVTIGSPGGILSGSIENPTLANGTANASGTAYKGGSWGADKTETALGGELGPEMRVRNGRWELIGQDGAEFFDVKKGDIIFNHKQTEQLLSNGYVTGRGKAYASGTVGGAAYSGLWKPISPDKSLSGSEIKNSASKLSKAADDLSKSSDELSEDFKEVFDWIEVRIEEITEDLDLLSARLENAIGSSKQNSIIDDMIDTNKKLYENLTAGASKYYEYAKKLLTKVPAEYRDAAQDGSIAIESFTGTVGESTLEAIQDYREWVQKGADLTQQAEETLTEISSLAKQAIDNIAADYENKISIPTIKLDQLEAYNELAETMLGAESEKIYQAMIKVNDKNIALLEDQRDAMQAEFNKRVTSGEIKKYSQDWYDAVNAIAEVDTEILNLTSDIEGYQDAINELHWDHFDNILGRLQAISDEADSLIDIIGSKGLVDKDTAEWTDEGITALGLYAQQLENAEMQAAKYGEEIKYLNKNWQKLGYTEQEYVEKLEELKNGQYDAIKAYEDTKDSIVDLNKERVEAIKEGIQKEIDAYQELIEAKKEELDAEKDLYDFQKNVADQQKNIADIERKLAALSSDNSASARAQRAKLQAELAEAQQELQDTYYDRSISDQQDTLDKELEAFQEEKDKEIEGWEEYLTETEQVVADSLATVQANTDLVYNTLESMGQEYSLSITEALTSPWAEGKNAIQDYSEQFGLSMSSTVEELRNVAAEYKEIITEIEGYGKEVIGEVNDNVSTYQGAKKNTNKSSDSNTSGGSDNSSTAGLVSALSGNIQYGDSGSNVKKLQRALNELGYGNSGTSSVDGIFGTNTQKAVQAFQKAMGISADGIVGPETKKKFKAKGYAKGATGIKKDQFALIDELGEELVLRPQNGRMTFLEKGSSVIPADLTANLMEWGALDPSTMLNQNRPEIAMSPSVVNNTMELSIDASVGELIHVEHMDGNNPAEITKIVDKAWDKYMKQLNAHIRRYTSR